tara:strand:- start:69 stop:488 length:420 start_codon:yes stop_codon:yes gene_type:complete
VSDQESLGLPTQTLQERLRERLQWRKVEKPKYWKPEEGEEIIGFYAGQTVVQRSWGEHTLILIHGLQSGTTMVSGMQAVQLIDGSGAKPGQVIRMVYKGTKTTQTDHEMKLFDLYVHEGDFLGDMINESEAREEEPCRS